MYSNKFYNKYKKDIYSQNGEDGILNYILHNLKILNPNFFKKLIKSLTSGSVAQFLSFVIPFAKQEAIKAFSVAPTDIFGNFIFVPFNFFIVLPSSVGYGPISRRCGVTDFWNDFCIFFGALAKSLINESAH